MSNRKIEPIFFILVTRT